MANDGSENIKYESHKFENYYFENKLQLTEINCEKLWLSVFIYN